MSLPHFPEFRKIEIGDRDQIQEILWNYRPEISELTFTNLFMWRKRYGFQYSILDKWLLLIAGTDEQNYAFEPVGPPRRDMVVIEIFKWLKAHGKSKLPQLCRVDNRLIDELPESKYFTVEPLRNHFDYVYVLKDMIDLSGRKYHAKRNHLHQFRNTFSFRYEPISLTNIAHCIEFSSRWCHSFHCSCDPGLCDEWVAIHEALHHFEKLHLSGAVLWINDRVEAFTFGELLNTTTTVIHIEKANPEIHGAYAAINQMFCRNQFPNIQYVNREQDLGDPGLRKAKESYHPVKLVEKFSIHGINE
jgi:hypothetical protein